MWSASNRGVLGHHVGDDTRAARDGGARPPAKAVDQLAEQPRPAEAAAADTTPSQPVAAIIAKASAASQMSPLPSTGMSAPRLQLADGRPPGVAGVVLLDGAGVQGDVADPSASAIRPAWR